MNAAPPAFAHRGDDLVAWSDAYAAGDHVSATDIHAAVAHALQPLLPRYRHLRAKHLFHLADPTADHFVQVQRGKNILTLHFGLTHHAVERSRAALFGPADTPSPHAPQTIAMWSANIGPFSKSWPLSYRVDWPVLGHEGLALALPEIQAFVEDHVRPYLERHRDPEAIRATCLDPHPRTSFFLQAASTVTAVDHLMGRDVLGGSAAGEGL